MNEAKASFNGYFRSPQGNKDQFTLRQADEQSDKDFLVRVRQFVKLLAENGWTEWMRPEDTDALENGKEETRSPHNGNQDTATRNGNGNGSAKSFELESIMLATGGEHPRWVIKGGNFKKFGVTCWPETLEAAGIADKLDPLKENKPKGRWVAKYVERENDEGRWVPDKVVSLDKVKD